MGWLAYERTRHQVEGGLMPLLWVGRRDGGQASASPGTDLVAIRKVAANLSAHVGRKSGSEST
jgi:hypothetical protein